jgi:5-methyltetrahydropteroyltriglutamate--homocysteine methyltransferase
MAARYRAEQVGSLLRPPELLKARADNSEGKLSESDLRLIEDRAILQALEKQRQLGMDILTDGEMRRASWLHDMAEAVDGFVPHQIMLNWKGPGGAVEASHALAAGAKLRKVRQLTGHELPFLKKSAPGPFKITLPAPSNFMLASYQPGITDKFYASHEDFLADLVDIVRDENQWLVSQGVKYIQLDAPFYSHYLDPEKRKQMRDPDAEFDKAIGGDNASLKGVSRENLTVAFHICRGNNRSRWYTEGGYDAIAEKLFGTLDVDTFLLEYDTERSGGFEPLRLVPRGKTVVLGLVTTKDSRLESQDELLRRINEAARYVPMENLALSTQCGFASVAAGNLLSIDEQWRKLELVVKTARKAWGN